MGKGIVSASCKRTQRLMPPLCEDGGQAQWAAARDSQTIRPKFRICML